MGELVLLNDSASGIPARQFNWCSWRLSYFEYQQLHKQNQVFADFFAAQNGNDDLKYSIGKGAEEAGHGRLVTGNYFAVLRARAALGERSLRWMVGRAILLQLRGVRPRWGSGYCWGRRTAGLPSSLSGDDAVASHGFCRWHTGCAGCNATDR